MLYLYYIGSLGSRNHYYFSISQSEIVFLDPRKFNDMRSEVRDSEGYIMLLYMFDLYSFRYPTNRNMIFFIG